MALFDPKATIFNWASILIQGPMDGEWYTAEHNVNAVELHKGAQGFGTFVVSADKSGTVKAILSQKSPTNRLLSAAFNAGNVIGPLLMTEKDVVTTKCTGAEAMIMKHAPIKRGQTVIGMEWTWTVNELILIAGGDA